MWLLSDKRADNLDIVAHKDRIYILVLQEAIELLHELSIGDELVIDDLMQLITNEHLARHQRIFEEVRIGDHRLLVVVIGLQAAERLDNHIIQQFRQVLIFCQTF